MKKSCPNDTRKQTCSFLNDVGKLELNRFVFFYLFVKRNKLRSNTLEFWLEKCWFILMHIFSLVKQDQNSTFFVKNFSVEISYCSVFLTLLGQEKCRAKQFNRDYMLLSLFEFCDFLDSV